MNSDEWPFSDSRNVAVFTVAAIVDGRAPILRVCHDQDDGAWQFLTGANLPPEQEWMLVALSSVAKLDPSIKELADLPLGWEATRTAPNSIWVKKPLEDK